MDVWRFALTRTDIQIAVKFFFLSNFTINHGGTHTPVDDNQFPQILKK